MQARIEAFGEKLNDELVHLEDLTGWPWDDLGCLEGSDWQYQEIAETEPWLDLWVQDVLKVGLKSLVVDDVMAFFAFMCDDNAVIEQGLGELGLLDGVEDLSHN